MPPHMARLSRTMLQFAATFAKCGFERAAFRPCYGLAEATLIVSAGPLAHETNSEAAVSKKRTAEDMQEGHSESDVPSSGCPTAGIEVRGMVPARASR